MEIKTAFSMLSCGLYYPAPRSKQAFNIHQISHKLAASCWHFTWLALSQKQNFMHVKDIWKTACLSPLEHNPPQKTTVKETMATLLSHQQQYHNSKCRMTRGGWPGGACMQKAEETKCEIKNFEVAGRNSAKICQCSNKSSIYSA